jgi:uncharacterized membrane protein YdjX (TVP38/TMEM64 family)
MGHTITRDGEVPLSKDKDLYCHPNSERDDQIVVTQGFKKRGTKRFILFLLILVMAFLLFRLTSLNNFVQKGNLLIFLSSIKKEWWGPTIFILIYGISCVIALPGLVLTLAGGAIFGTFLGTIYNIIASNIGASLAFFLARFLGQEFVASFLKGGKLASFDDKMAKNGFKTIFRLRLIPVIPFNGLNFGAGFSHIKYRDYLLGSMLGMLPATFILHISLMLSSRV